jgi:hypothetical protein
MEEYAFRPMTAADLPLLRRWLETPEVVLMSNTHL